MSFHAVPDFQFYPVHSDGLPIEGDLCAYLRLQSQLQIAVTWRYCEQVQEIIPFFDSVDWDATILNIHGGNLPGSLATSMSMCADQAYRVKTLHGMLPTATRLLVTHPGVYHDNLCSHCLQVAESPAHLWRCHCSSEAVNRTIADDTSLFWRLARMYKCLLASVGSDIFPGPHTVYEAVQGVVPLEWTTILQRCRVSARGAHSVVQEVGKFFVSTVHEAI